MRTVVFGRSIKNNYVVRDNKKMISDDYRDYYLFTAKPTIEKEVKIVSWDELLSFEGEPRYNKGTKSSNSKFNFLSMWDNRAKINISENEEVFIDEEIFRADLNELHLHTDKIMYEDDNDKENQMDLYESLIAEFNEQMIDSNDKLRSYCKLHNLIPRCTDCIELFKLVFPNEEYVIEDGVMKVKEKPQLITKYLPIDGSFLSETICGRTCSGEITSRG